MLQKVQAIFRDILGDDTLVIGPEFSMHKNPEWDSVAMVQVALALESAYGIQFTIEELTAIRSVADILNVLKNHGC
ncbi:MAG: hypothetical protein A2Y14_00655 [Verrucomicrobia bacterium GWF2_51_19]|nr:MAG: hypothetical protein A2Y14_00655 [Verrucomicrobia bacterium GWF2_51_19]HCJ12431.1 hypothetical protein [Opitutae bacterium]